MSHAECLQNANLEEVVVFVDDLRIILLYCVICRPDADETGFQGLNLDNNI